MGQSKENKGEVVPAHVAIIMDGNGRWARQKRLPRIIGHYAGVKAVEKTVIAALELGVNTSHFLPFPPKTGNVRKARFMGYLVYFDIS